MEWPSDHADRIQLSFEEHKQTQFKKLQKMQKDIFQHQQLEEMNRQVSLTQEHKLLAQQRRDQKIRGISYQHLPPALYDQQPLQLLFRDPPAMERLSSAMHQRPPPAPTNQVWPQEGPSCHRSRDYDNDGSDSDGTKNAMATARKKRAKQKINTEAYYKREEKNRAKPSSQRSQRRSHSRSSSPNPRHSSKGRRRDSSTD